MSRVSVVIVSYNSAEWLPRCLDALQVAVGDLDVECIVIDNASADDSCEILQSRPEVRLLTNSANVGFAQAVNMAAKQASGDWLLLLNPDTEVGAQTLRELLEFTDAHPQYHFVGGRAFTESGVLDPASCWALPTLWSLACFATGMSTAFRGNRVFDPESLGNWKRDSVREVGMITGCLLLVRRDTWEQLGGFDPDYFVYGEDADLAFRADALGLARVIDPAATLMHAKSASLDSQEGKFVLLMSGKITYLNKNWSGMRQRAGVTMIRLGVLLRHVLERLTRGDRGWSGAWARRIEWWNGYPPHESAALPEPT